MKNNKLLLCLTISCLTLSSTISTLIPLINDKKENNNLNIEVNNQQKIN